MTSGETPPRGVGLVVRQTSPTVISPVGVGQLSPASHMTSAVSLWPSLLARRLFLPTALSFPAGCCRPGSMLTRKQQWRRTRVRRDRSCAAAAAAAVASGTDEKMTVDLEGHERADSDQTTLSAWSSFDSLREDEDGDSCSAVPLARRPAPAAAERSVSFQQEVQVFLVTHKSELDTR